MEFSKLKPKFEIGQNVSEIKRLEVIGVIDYYFWHFKDNEYKYQIAINAKRKSKRYSEAELKSV